MDYELIETKVDNTGPPPRVATLEVCAAVVYRSYLEPGGSPLYSGDYLPGEYPYQEVTID